MTLDVRWVGTLARKQAGNLNLNTTNVFYNPELLDALERTRRGENVDLFDRDAGGSRFEHGGGLRSGGHMHDCRGSTGRWLLSRRNSSRTRVRTFAPLASGRDSGQSREWQLFWRHRTLLGTNAPQGGYYGVVGGTGLPAGITALSNRNSTKWMRPYREWLVQPGFAASATNIPTRCFSEDYFAANSQLNAATYNSNLGRSSHHQLQVQSSMRPTAQGFSFQSTYTWAKAMQIPGSGYTDPLAAKSRSPSRTRGAAQLPYERHCRVAYWAEQVAVRETSGWVARLIERWQTSFILNLENGSPGDVTGAGTTRYANPRYVATAYWQIPEGHVEWGASNGNQGRFYGDDVYTFASSTPSAATLPWSRRPTAAAMLSPPETAHSWLWLRVRRRVLRGLISWIPLIPLQPS